MDILIRRIPEETVKQAKALALRHHRSLQQEIAGMLIETIRFRTGKWSVEADVIRKRLVRKHRRFSDTAALLRADRGR